MIIQYTFKDYITAFQGHLVTLDYSLYIYRVP
jgi:hypothetical protein